MSKRIDQRANVTFNNETKLFTIKSFEDLQSKVRNSFKQLPTTLKFFAKDSDDIIFSIDSEDQFQEWESCQKLYLVISTLERKDEDGKLLKATVNADEQLSMIKESETQSFVNISQVTSENKQDCERNKFLDNCEVQSEILLQSECEIAPRIEKNDEMNTMQHTNNIDQFQQNEIYETQYIQNPLDNLNQNDILQQFVQPNKNKVSTVQEESEDQFSFQTTENFQLQQSYRQATFSDFKHDEDLQSIKSEQQQKMIQFSLEKKLDVKEESKDSRKSSRYEVLDADESIIYKDFHVTCFDDNFKRSQTCTKGTLEQKQLYFTPIQQLVAPPKHSQEPQKVDDSHNFLDFKKLEKNPHQRITCSNCQKLITQDFMYTCSYCAGMISCEQCETELQHSMKHPLILIRNIQQLEAIKVSQLATLQSVIDTRKSLEREKKKEILIQTNESLQSLEIINTLVKTDESQQQRQQKSEEEFKSFETSKLYQHDKAKSLLKNSNHSNQQYDSLDEYMLQQSFISIQSNSLDHLRLEYILSSKVGIIAPKAITQFKDKMKESQGKLDMQTIFSLTESFDGDMTMIENALNQIQFKNNK